MQFTSDQLLIFSYIEDFSSAFWTKRKYQPLMLSRLYQYLLMVVEVQLHDIVFIIAEDDFYLGDLFVWVKRVTFSEVFCSNLEFLIIIKSEAKWKSFIPLNLCDFQFS